MPLTSFADDVAALDRTLERVAGPVVLAGHAYAGAVIAARVGRLVYGAADPRAGAAGSLWDVLHDRRLGLDVEVIAGVLASECSGLLRDFFAQLRNSGEGRDV